MKRLIFVMTIVLIVFFGLVSVLSGAVDVNSQDSDAQIEKPASVKPAVPQKTAAVELPSDANEIIDFNEPNAAPGPNDVNEIIRKQFGPLENIWKKLDSSGQAELDAWMEQTVERRANIVKVVNDQMMAELDFVRQLAVQEKASKTTIAIDRLLQSRKLRVESVLKQLEESKVRRSRIEELREKRQKEQEERRRDAEERRRERQRNY